MDITVIGDRIELNGFGLGLITGDAPPGLKAKFERFLQGTHEDELDYQAPRLTDDDLEKARDCGFADGAASKMDEIEDFKAMIEELCDAVEDNDQEEIENLLQEARSML